MTRLLSALLASTLLLLGPARAQSDVQKINEINSRAGRLLKASKFDEGIAELMKVFDIQPKDMGTAYNLACAYSLKADVDKSYEWLSKAADWGWGLGTGSVLGLEQLG